MSRVLAGATRVWLRRSLQIHAIAVLCMAPLVLLSEWRDPFRDGRILGIFGLYPAAWALSLDLVEPRQGFLLDVTLAYLLQFAVMAVLVRDAYRHLAGRAPRNRARGFLGLPLLALGSLAAFVALNSLVAAATEGSPGPAFLIAILTTVGEAVLAATCWLALPAAVDGYGPFSALRRSRLLAQGSGFTVWLLAVMPVFLVWIALVVFALVVEALDFRHPPNGLAAVPLILFLPLKACILAAAYHEACLRKEGPRADELGAVFA